MTTTHERGHQARHRLMASESPASHISAGLPVQRIPARRGGDTARPSDPPMVLLARLRATFCATELGVAVSVLDPADPYVTAARLGVEIAFGRDNALLLDNYVGGRWHRPNLMPSVTELERRRYPPHGDRAEWIAYGPAGRPTGREEGAG